jgi:flagellar biosynthesis protein FlhF
MHIKTYRAVSAQEAIRMVKKEMGADAVILRTRTLSPPKGDSAAEGRRVEVTAAVDYEPSGDGFPSNGSAEIKTLLDHYQTLAADVKVLKEAVLCAEGGGLLKPEIYHNQDLRTRYLNFRGFGLRPEIICELMNGADGKQGGEAVSTGRLLQDSLARVLRRIGTQGESGDRSGRRIVSFIGPTGVGKTTTLAKMAALSAVRQGRKTALITVDTFRVAAVAQLESYARIMGIPLEVAANPGDLLKAIRRQKACDFILIDTAGSSPSHAEALRELKNVLSIPEEIHSYLVLSATTRYEDLLHADRQFGSLPFASYIFTKLDETEDASSMINFLVSRKRPVSYFTTGQQVPEDIESASKKRLASLLLTRMKKDIEKPAHEVKVYGSGEWSEGNGSRVRN